MGTQSNQNASNSSKTAIREASIRVPVPASNENLYRYSATDDILSFLIDRPFDQYTFRKLASIVDVSHRTVSMAVEVLEDNYLVDVENRGNKKLVQINSDRIQTPDSGMYRIPQSEFHEPVNEAIEELRTELEEVLGILVFGSVARGEADRQSDIDLWVLVRDDRSRQQSRATALGKELGQTEIEGDRYSFHIIVESPESVPAHTEDIASIVRTGIPVYQTPDFEQFRSLMEGMTDER